MKFILISPSDSTTGGIESMHQFGRAIKDLGLQCEVFYVGKTNKAQEYFSFYGLDKSKSIDDKENNIVIFPEIYTNIIHKIKKSKVGIFWLSIDNYLYRKRDSFLKDKFNEIRSLIGGRIPTFRMKNYIHLAQSQYAKNFLKTKGLKSFLIEDYINEDFLKSAIDIDLSLKKPVITYNPSKGKKYMDLFKKLFPEINMTPLVGMTRVEMIKCLKESMVYLDLGQHPGRDRIPREAAVQGCVVMTSKFGSAENSLDVAIDEFYKTNTSYNDILKLGPKVHEIFKSFSEHLENQAKYRRIIMNDKDRVQLNVKKFIDNFSF
tara:strand:- start:2472 stop:3428 length:957 start_codon:yes stop_codon:yes gene_type:complete